MNTSYLTRRKAKTPDYHLGQLMVLRQMATEPETIKNLDWLISLMNDIKAGLHEV